ncbi:MAG TPA: isochorismatase family protein [Pirellulales bacterium]|jgi:nicotinamidase-related amidase
MLAFRLLRAPLAMFLVMAPWTASCGASAASDAVWTISQRSRSEKVPGSGEYTITETPVDWDPRQTAVIVCDMWDRHWCQGATDRVAEMAPRMNEALKAARRLGMLVIHCPSDTMKFYADMPQRKLAQQALRVPVQSMPAGWCPLGAHKEPPLPFDNSHDRCDCTPQCPHGNPWRRQIATLEIADNDAITDSEEAYFLMRERGIKNVVVMGVHTNMCVLGRPFSIRRMAALGQNVVLVRDLTDCMHDALSAPEGLDHFRATDLVVEHIEKHWCPTITSHDLLEGTAFVFREDQRPHAVFVIGEDEYETWNTLPVFAEKELAPRGLRVTIVQANPRDKNDFPGLEALPSADALLVSVRRRTPQQQQLDLIRRFVAAGKPVVGIRTASHAFSLRDDKPASAGHDTWPEFDAQVLGGHYTGHHENNDDGTPRTEIWSLPEARSNPILAGFPDQEVRVISSLYKTSPLAASATPLVMGRGAGGKLDEPVAWTNKTAFGGKVFYVALGGPTDFEVPAFRNLLTKGIFWALGKPVPETPVAARQP